MAKDWPFKNTFNLINTFNPDIIRRENLKAGTNITPIYTWSMWRLLYFIFPMIFVLGVAFPVTAKSQLLVSVYRGNHPDIQGVRTFSTRTQTNKLQHFSVQDGQLLVVSEKSIVKIPVESSRYFNNSEVVVDPDAVVPDRTPIQLASVDGELQVVDVATIDDNSLELGLPIEGNSQQLKGEFASSEKSQLVEILTGIYIKATLVKPVYRKNPKVNLEVKVVSPSSSLEQSSTKDAGVIRLTQGIETKTVITLSQWQQVASNRSLSYRPSFNNRSKVVSTSTKNDNQDAIWIKVELVR